MSSGYPPPPPPPPPPPQRAGSGTPVPLAIGKPPPPQATLTSRPSSGKPPPPPPPPLSLSSSQQHQQPQLAGRQSTNPYDDQTIDILLMFVRQYDLVADPEHSREAGVLEARQTAITKAAHGVLEQDSERIFLFNFEQQARVSTPAGSRPLPSQEVTLEVAAELLHAIAENSQLDARAFVAWRRVCLFDCGLSKSQVQAVEANVSHIFARGGHVKSKGRRMSRTRIAMIGGAAVVGGGLLAATGAAAAPLMAGAAVAAHATGTAAFLGSAVGMGAVAGTLGVAGAYRTGYKMARRTGGLREFDFLQLKNKDEAVTPLVVTIGISGWLAKDSLDSLVDFWAAALPEWMGTREALMFDRKELVSYGNALSRFAAVQIAENAAFGGMIVAGGAAGSAAATALTPPLLALMAQDVVDSPYAVAKNKSKLAGQELARALLGYAVGHRPVNLVGFGFGACCAFYCLEALAQAGPAGMGLVADVCLFGTPMRPDPARWLKIRRVVAGSLVSHFNTKDSVLKYLMKVSTKSFPCPGVEPVSVPGVIDMEVESTHYEIGTNPRHLNFILSSTLGGAA